jgi:hypothetical protein
MTEKEVIKELENKILEIESEKNQILNENIKMKQMIEDINRDSLSSIHISHTSKESKDEILVDHKILDQFEEKSLQSKCNYKLNNQNQTSFFDFFEENNICEDNIESFFVSNFNKNKFENINNRFKQNNFENIYKENFDNW